MAEQQLVDYIKNAKVAGQSDDQSRALLKKNGWLDSEINDAFSAQPQQSQPAAQIQPQAKPQPQVASQPELIDKPQVQPQPRTQPESASAMQMQNNMSYRRPSSHLALKLLAVLIIVILLGVGYFYAGAYLNLPYANIFSITPIAPEPQEAVNNMLLNMTKVKSSHMSLQGDINAVDKDKKSQGRLIFNLSGDSDITDSNTPKANYTFSFQIKSPDSSNVSASGALMALGNTAYIKLNSYAATNAAYLPNPNSDQIKGFLQKWLKVDQNSINALSQAGGIPMQGGVSQTNTAELPKKIQELLSGKNIISVDKQLRDEVIGGQDTYHYLVKIGKDKISALINKVMAAQNTAASPNSSDLLAQNMAKTLVSAFADAVGDINMEIWVGKKDYMLYKATINKVIDLNKISSTINSQLELKFTATNSSFDKPVVIQAPADAQKIEDAIAPLLMSQKVSMDIAAIGSGAQSLFSVNNNYSSLCTRGLLNGYLASYGAGLIDLNNSIVAQGAKKPVCLSAVQDYCISTQLSDGSFICIDKNNIIGKTQCVLAETLCK